MSSSSGKWRPARRCLPRGSRQWPGSAGRPFQGQRGAGIRGESARAFVVVPEPPPPPQASAPGLQNELSGSAGPRSLRGIPHLPDGEVQKAGLPGAERTWVCCGSAGSLSPGDARAVPGPGPTHRHPGPNGGRPAGETAEAAQGTRSARPGPRRPPPLPSPSARLRPGPGPRRRPAHPYSLAARSAAWAAAAPPAPRPRRPPAAPFVSAGQCPRRLPRPGPALHSPPPRCRSTRLPAAAGEPGRWEPGARSRQEGLLGTGEGPGLRGGGDGEGGEKSAAEGRGKRRAPLCKLSGRRVGPRFHGAPNPLAWPSGGL